VGVGLVGLWKLNRRLLAGLAAWIVPVIVVSVLFKIEGQYDFWMVAAWIPLWLVAAIGLSAVRRLREAAVVAALAGTVWAVVANRPDLDQRHYTLAETFGHAQLDLLVPGSSLSVESDDASSILLYLQRIRDVRRDVSLNSPGAGTTGNRIGWVWADYSEMSTREGVGLSSNVYYIHRWGPFWVNERGATLKPWKEPIAAEHVPRFFRRARGQFIDRSRLFEIRVHPEPYENRLLRLLLRARKTQADEDAAAGKLLPASQLYESILALDPEMRQEPTVVQPLAVVYVGLKQYEKAEAMFRRALALDLLPAKRAEAYYFLAALCGARPEAAEWRAKALGSPDLPGGLRSKLEGR